MDPPSTVPDSGTRVTLSPELETAVRKEVVARLKIWAMPAILVLLALLSVVAYLLAEVRALKGKAVLKNEPVIIYNPAWDTVIDAVDPAWFPGTHPDDIRKGTRVQQWPVHGGPQHIWQLRQPSGERYQTNAPLRKVTTNQ